MEIGTNGLEILKAIGNRIKNGFEIIEEDVSNYKKLWYYFTKSEKCKEAGIDPNKCLWIYGDIGLGKSLAIKVMQEFCFFTPHLGNRKLTIYRWQKIEDDYSDKDIRSTIYDTYGNGAEKDICYDEFLRDKSIVNDFGIKKNLAERLLADRYDLFVEKGFKTHLISNLTPMSLKEDKILDERILDRFNELFNYILWEGVKSKRKKQ